MKFVQRKTVSVQMSQSSGGSVSASGTCTGLLPARPKMRKEYRYPILSVLQAKLLDDKFRRVGAQFSTVEFEMDIRC